jgi:hypothetical protein
MGKTGTSHKTRTSWGMSHKVHNCNPIVLEACSITQTVHRELPRSRANCRHLDKGTPTSQASEAHQRNGACTTLRGSDRVWSERSGQSRYKCDRLRDTPWQCNSHVYNMLCNTHEYHQFPPYYVYILPKVGPTRFWPTSHECDIVLHLPWPIHLNVCRMAEPCWCSPGHYLWQLVKHY